MCIELILLSVVVYSYKVLWSMFRTLRKKEKELQTKLDSEED